MGLKLFLLSLVVLTLVVQPAFAISLAELRQKIEILDLAANPEQTLAGPLHKRKNELQKAKGSCPRSS